MRASFSVFLLAAISFPASAAPKKPTPASQMLAQYHVVRAVFWHAEGKLQERIETREDCRAAYSVLPADDPLRAEYSRVASAADRYLKIADENKLPVSPAMIYLGGLAKYSLGDYSGAPILMERLCINFPDYRRSRYEGEDPRWGVPAAPAISKLLFYCRFQVALAKPGATDAFMQLKQITSEALRSLQLQREFAALVASQTDQYNTYDFDEASFGGGLFNGQPCQARAGALPSTLELVDEAWTKLLEPALKKSGAQAMRDWLRGLSNPSAPLSRLALYHLQNIDALIIKQIFADAQQQMNAHNYDGARVKYKELIAQYPGTDAAQRASDALPQIAPVAVAYYAAQGAQHFQPEAKGQFLQAQSKAAEDYARMYREATGADARSADAQGDVALRAQAETALMGWARADATQSDKLNEAASLLQKHLNAYPQSSSRPQALLLLGMIDAGGDASHRQSALGVLSEIVAKYPQSPEAPEALWKIGVLHFAANRKAEASKAFEQLGAQYPKSQRAKYVAGWVAYLKKS